MARLLLVVAATMRVMACILALQEITSVLVPQHTRMSLVLREIMMLRVHDTIYCETRRSIASNGDKFSRAFIRTIQRHTQVIFCSNASRVLASIGREYTAMIRLGDMCV